MNGRSCPWHRRLGHASSTRCGFEYPARFDMWAEGRISRFDTGAGDGTFPIVTLGADNLVNDRLVFGLGVQADWTKLDADTETGITGDADFGTDGFGFLIVPFLTAKLAEALYLDIRTGWRPSFNDVSTFASISDDFSGDRWLATSALIGDFNWKGALVNPELRSYKGLGE